MLHSLWSFTIKCFFKHSNLSNQWQEPFHSWNIIISKHWLPFLFYSILFYPIALEGCRDTIDEFATIPFHLVLFSAALVELAKSIPVHSLILSFHLFFCLPFVLCPYTVPCRIALAKPEDIQMWRNYMFWPGSEVHHILQWLLGSFCKPPHWKLV